MLQAVFCIMYHAALRVSEICYSHQSKHALKYHQVRVEDNEGGNKIVIQFSTYKHIKHPCPPLLVSPTGSDCCPVKIMNDYQNLRGKKKAIFSVTVVVHH